MSTTAVCSSAFDLCVASAPIAQSTSPVLAATTLSTPTAPNLASKSQQHPLAVALRGGCHRTPNLTTCTEYSIHSQLAQPTNKTVLYSSCMKMIFSSYFAPRLRRPQDTILPDSVACCCRIARPENTLLEIFCMGTCCARTPPCAASRAKSSRK